MTEGRSTEVVRIDALVCGPEFLSLLDEPRVIAIAERIGRTGAWDTTPIVRASDMAVIAGEDVIAALCRLDIDELRVELVHDGSLDDEPGTELSPDVETRYAGGAVAAVAERTDVTPAPFLERARAAAAESERLRAEAEAAEALVHPERASLHERTDVTPAPVVLSEFDSMEVVMDHRLGVLSVSASSGGQRATLERVEAVRAQVGTQRAAVAAVSAETGRSEHAVKKAANRAKRAKDKVSIETWGRPQPEAWMAATAELRRALTNASNSIRTAMSALSPALEAGVPGIMLEVTHGDLKAMAAHLRSVRPACVCAWCKNEPTLVERCVACGGRGWLGEQKMSLVPKELFPPGSAMAQGRPVELEPPVADVTVDGMLPAYSEVVPELRAAMAQDAAPLESRSHTVEPVSAEHAEAAWDALEGASGGEAFLDDEDGGVW